MDKRLLLVVPIRLQYNVPAIDLGLRYLGAAAQRIGWHVEILHCGLERFNYDQFSTFIRTNHFDVIGFKCFSYDFNSIRRHAQIIKAVSPASTILAGGPHPSSLPDLTLKQAPEIDFGFVGEAELSLPMFLERLEDIRIGDESVCAEIPGLIWRNHNSVNVNKSVYVNDLDELGMPDWDIINPTRYPDTTIGRYIPIITTRGCPYPCSYCGAFNVVGRKLRYRSVSSIIEEVGYLAKKYGIHKFSIADDNFTFKTKFAMDVCEGLRSADLKIEWDCSNGIRLDTVKTELLKAMDASGCYSVAVGVESGSQRILDKMHKKLTLEETTEKIHLIKDKSHIKITGFHMMGYPGETIHEMHQTIKRACALPLDHANFSLVIPIPGTELWDELIRDGAINPDTINWDNLYADCITFHRKGIADEDLLKLQRQAYFNFYTQPRVMMNTIKEILTSRNLYKILLRKAASVILRK